MQIAKNRRQNMQKNVLVLWMLEFDKSFFGSVKSGKKKKRELSDK